MVTPDGWKLNLSQRGEHELYDLSSDPGETENLFYRTESAPIVDRLKEEIARWQKRTGDAKW